MHSYLSQDNAISEVANCFPLERVCREGKIVLVRNHRLSLLEAFWLYEGLISGLIGRIVCPTV